MKVKQIYRRLLCAVLSVLLSMAAAAGVNLTVEDTQEAVAVSSAVRTQSYEAERGKTLKILAIGNSFTKDTMRYAYEIAASAGYDLKVGVLWRSSSTLADHVKYIRNEQAMYRYDVYASESVPEDETLEITEGEETPEGGQSGYVAPSAVLSGEAWDLVFLQQASYDNGNPASLFDADGASYLATLTQLVRERVSNPELSFAWLMGWAYGQEYRSTRFEAYYGSDQLTMYQAITDTLRSYIWPTGLFDLIIPVGTAVQNVRTSYIGDNMTRDAGLHLNYSIGRYTAGLTVASSIGIPLKRVEFLPDNSTRVSELHLPMLREAVQAAVRDPYSITPSSYPNTDWLPSAEISSIRDTAGGITIKWYEVKGAKTYYVYRRSLNGEWEQVVNTSARKDVHVYTDRTVQHGVKYSYCIYTRFDSKLPYVLSGKRNMVHTVSPEITSVSSAKKRKMSVRWRPQEGTASYQLRYADNTRMKRAKTVTIRAGYRRAVIQNLRSKTSYVVQMRSIVKIGGKTYKSAWGSLWLCTVR